MDLLQNKDTIDSHNTSLSEVQQSYMIKLEQSAETENRLKLDLKSAAVLQSELKEEKGRTGSVDDNRTRERIEVLGPEVALEQLKRSITTMLVDRLGVRWDERFAGWRRRKAVAA